MNLKDKVVVVTGAASGIGEALAVELSKQGAHLALADINEVDLQQTVKRIESSGVKVKADKLDISDQAAFFSYAADVVDYFGQVDCVINNAGRSVADGFVDGSVEDFRMVMDVNFWGCYYGTKAFLPHLMARPKAMLVNVSSVNALIPFPNQSSYNVSKAAIMGMNESLVQELKGTSVQVMSVYPGGIQTNIVKNSKFIRGPKEGMTQDESAELFKKVAMTSAPKAARKIIRGIKRGKSRLRIGPDAYLFDYLKRMSPRFAVWLIGKVARA